MAIHLKLIFHFHLFLENKVIENELSHWTYIIVECTVTWIGVKSVDSFLYLIVWWIDIFNSNRKYVIELLRSFCIIVMYMYVWKCKMNLLQDYRNLIVFIALQSVYLFWPGRCNVDISKPTILIYYCRSNHIFIKIETHSSYCCMLFISWNESDWTDILYSCYANHRPIFVICYVATKFPTSGFSSYTIYNMH